VRHKILFMIFLSVQILFTGCSESTFTIGGTIAGTDRIFVITLNDDEVLEVDGSDETFQFETSLKKGSAYEVVVSDQPTSATCTVANGTGTVSDQDIVDIEITCVED
jgi:hypothetical protein